MRKGVTENSIRVDGGIAYISVESKSRSFEGEAIIDLSDLPKIIVLGRKWHAGWNETTQQFFARANDKINGVWAAIMLHRFLTDAPKGLDVDHVNHVMLDCRRENMRVCTRGENLQNRRGAMCTSSSGIRGVWFDKSRGKWTAEIKVNYKKIFLGRFDSMDLAREVVEDARAANMPFSSECRG